MALRPDSVKRPTNLRVRRFIAKYIMYLEVIGYLFVIVIGATIAALWLIKIDDTAKAAGSGPTPNIKPFEEVISWPRECLAVELLVEDLPPTGQVPPPDPATPPDHRNVGKGEPLVRLTDDPRWIAEQKKADRYQKIIDNIDAAEKDGPLSPTLAAARKEAQAVVEQWTKQRAALPTKTVRAPIAGMLNGADKSKIEGKVFAADAKLFTVVDFTDLRIPVKITGANVSHGRLLQEAKFKVKDNYGDGELVRVDMKERGRLTRRRVEFLDVSGGVTKDLVADFFGDKTLTVKRDLGFHLDKVSNVEVLSRDRAEPLAQLPTDPAKIVRAEPLHDKEFRAVMIDGFHYAKVKLTRFDEEQRRKLLAAVQPALTGKATVIIDPKTGERLCYRLKDLRQARFLVTMTLKQPRAGKETTKEIARRLKQENAVLTDQLERNYQGHLRVLHPSPALQHKVRELFLHDPPKYLTADVEWIVDKRRIAMLLFRQ